MDPDVGQVFDELSEKFYALRQQRMAITQDQLTFDFLGDDVIMRMMEALADLANQCDMQFIKLALLQNHLSEEVKDKAVGDGSGIGLGSFQRASEHWKDNQR